MGMGTVRSQKEKKHGDGDSKVKRVRKLKEKKHGDG